jgi:hypothetical protein
LVSVFSQNFKCFFFIFQLGCSDLGVTLTFLLVGAGFFVLLSVIGFVRGYKLKEKAYCTTGFVCVLLSVWLLLFYFNQFILGFGFFIASVVIALAIRSKVMKATSKETSVIAKKTVLSESLKFVDIFSWTGWFKIVNRWGKRVGLVFYVLFNLAFIWILPVLLLVLDVGKASFWVLIIFGSLIGVVSSVAIFNQQVIRNIDAKKVEP